MRKWPLETQILAGFLLALGVLAIIGALIYRSTVQFGETAAAADRSRQVLSTLEGIYSLVSQTESRQRAFLITGDPDDLAPRELALAQTRQMLGELQALARDGPQQTARLTELEQRVAERMSLLEQVLETYRAKGFEAAREQFLVDQGIDEMQRLRDAVAVLGAAETERLEILRRDARRSANGTLVSLALLLVLSASSLSLLYARVRREIQARQQTQRTLESHAEELRDSESRLRAVVDTAIDAIIVIDERGVMERVNQAAERIFGYGAEEMVGRNVRMLMPSPDREQHDGYLSRYLQGGAPRIIGIGREVVAQRKDGSLFPIDLAVSEMHVRGHRMFTGIVRDITERKRAEAQRAQLIDDLETVNEELTNFAYVVSHDLKAPLRAIGSLADWIATDYTDRLDAEGQEHLRLLKSRVRRMDSLIDGILEYSRVGRVRERAERVDLNALLRDTIDLLAPPAHLRIVIEDTLPTVTLEPTRLRQVFQNLLSNAIKFSDKPEGRIRVGCRADDGTWHFSVADNGPGIDPRHHERIFQLFQTLAPRDRVESTGVGLALVKKIVEMYGGRVWLDSIPGHGSTFHFTLPRVAAGVSSMKEKQHEN